MKKIICVHLMNDYSGSPLVLSTVVKNFISRGLEVEVLTSAGGKGFLSELEGVRYRYFHYRFFEQKLFRLAALLWSQVELFFRVLLYARQDVVIYVNTLLPFGAALAGRITRKKVIYHLHETTVNPPAFKAFLKKVAAGCADEAIYVSRFLMEQEVLPGVSSQVIYNCLSRDFLEKAEAETNGVPRRETVFTVLMLCSLKTYKGVDEFVKLAAHLQDIRFVLVLNSQKPAIDAYFQACTLPENLIIFPAQSDVHSFYREAHLVMNLSHPEKWVETFGMTLLEAMSYGLPVIAPPLGGPVELVEDGYNGYKVDQRNFSSLVEKIKRIYESRDLWKTLSANASVFASRFNEQQFGNEIFQVVQEVQPVPVYSFTR